VFVAASVVVVGGLLLSGCGNDLGEARDLEEKGDLAGAVTAYQRMLEDEPDDLEALTGAATDLLLLQRFDEALPLQERIVALDPQDALTRVELGFNYLNHQERPLDAVGVFEEAAVLDPSAKNLCFLAQSLTVSGDEVGAEATLRRALESEPAYPRTYDLLIGLLEANGRTDEAQGLRELAMANGVSLESSP